MDYSARVSQLLLNCENFGITAQYGNPKVSFDSGKNDIFILSDLHLNSEFASDSKAPGSAEILLADSSFIKFIQYIQKQVVPDSGILVINGDFIDFLRVSSIPVAEKDFIKWHLMLRKIGINKDAGFLKSSITRRETRYGLNTSEYKSVWKLNLVIESHPGIFDALAEWLCSGNKIIILKGNHDLELYWPAVRNHIRLYLSERLAAGKNEDVYPFLQRVILPGLLFADDSLIIDGKYYVEHGHKYDKYCHCIGGPLLNNKIELNTPFGSYFNRYLLNHIEIAHPPFKTVREKKNILALLIEKRFFVGLKSLLQHIPVLFLIIPLRYYRFLFGRVLLICLTIFLPVLYIMDKFWNIVEPLTMRTDSGSSLLGQSFLKGFRVPGLKRLGNLILSIISFAVSRSGAYMHIEEPAHLNSFARKIFHENPGLKIVSFGHTHNPDGFEEDGRMYFNTGAWIAAQDDESRMNNNFTYLHIKARSSYSMYPGVFLKWNVQLNSPEPLELARTDDEILTSRHYGGIAGR